MNVTVNVLETPISAISWKNSANANPVQTTPNSTAAPKAGTPGIRAGIVANASGASAKTATT